MTEEQAGEDIKTEEWEIERSCDRRHQFFRKGAGKPASGG